MYNNPGSTISDENCASAPVQPSQPPQDLHVPAGVRPSTSQLQALGPAGVLYDISSLLQAHALQLTASAGLTVTGTVPIASATTTETIQPAEGGSVSLSGAVTSTAIQSGAHSASAEGQGVTLPQPQHAQQHVPSQLYLIQPQQSIPGSNTGISSAAVVGPTTQKHAVIQPLLAPAGANPQFLLPMNAIGGSQEFSAHAGGLPQHLLAQGFFPQQYLNLSAATTCATIPSPLSSASTSTVKREIEVQGAAMSDKKKRKPLEPSIVSSSTNTTHQIMASNPGVLPHSSSLLGQDPPPPKEASEEDLLRMTPAERRRYERNLREQQRSYRISQQIKELRDILVDSKFPFKPNKYSILLSVAEYIKQLQSRAIMLDTEHSKLIKTIRETNDMVNTGAPTTTDESVNPSSTTESGIESEFFFVKGIDYRSVFDQCPAALGITALDGRILECNTEFQTILGFPRRDDLLKQSLFNLVQNHQDIFRAMAQILKTAEGSTFRGHSQTSHDSNATTGGMMHPEGVGVDASPVTINAIAIDRFWTGPVTSKLNVKLLMNITLTLGDNGTPKFFSCSITSSPT